MEFIRIDESTVRCIVNEDDMREYNVEIDDFLKNRGKVQEFLHSIVERASDEVGYEPKDGLLAMQIMMLPKNRLAITFSEKMENGMGLEDLVQQVAGATIENGSSPNEQIEEEASADSSDMGKTKKTKKATVAPMRIFEFTNMKDFEQFVSIIPDKLTVKSSLYKDNLHNIYYVILEKGRLSKVNFNYVCRMASEYGRYLSDKEGRKAYIEEHHIALIEGKAVKVIKRISKVDS